MIIFYNKNTGNIFGVISGRVHDKNQMGMILENKETKKEDVGRYIIGWESTDEIEEYDEEVEKMVQVGTDIFKKIKTVQKAQRNKKIEHNLDKFELLQRFEGDDPENALDYKIDLITCNLVKMDKHS